VMGLALLVMRAKLMESGMFQHAKGSSVARGAFFKLFSSRELFTRYLTCILIGVPIWFSVSILVTFSPELTKTLGIEGVLASKAIMWNYLGLSIGDISSGLLSQYLKSRKKAVFAFLVLIIVAMLAYMRLEGASTTQFYVLCVILGFGTGYWAVFATIAAEQFGTNIRATVATTVPNFVRASVVPITLGFEALRPTYGSLNSAAIIGAIVMTIAFLALWKLQETFGKPLDYVERF
jgi:putative MFS transporter